MPVFASRSVFVVGRTAPVILSETVNQGDTLVFQASSGVFVNQPALGVGTNGLINIANTGSGMPLSSVSGNLISLKSLLAGANITLTTDGNTVTINSTGGSGPTSGVAVFYDILDYTSGTTTLISLPAGSIILSTEIAVLTAFNGMPTLTIGTDTTPDLLVENSDIDLSSVMSYKDDVSFVMPGIGNQDIKSFFTANGATEGRFSIFIEYALQ